MSRPNILFILADQHRQECLGCYGNEQIRTPNLDRIAADGVRYDQAYCTYPICTPSRYSLISGLYVHQHGGRSNHCTLSPMLPTWPKVLREAGYRTKAVGKMHFTPTYLDVGFDEMELAEQDGPGRMDDDYHRDLMERGLLDAFDLYDQRREFRERAPQHYWDHFGSERSDLPEPWDSTSWIADRAMQSLDAWEGDGNLLMVSFIKPHHPMDPPAPWDEMYDPAEMQLLPGYTEQQNDFDARSDHYYPDGEMTRADLQGVMAYYYATISQIDHHVGRMIQALQQKGMYEETLIVYASDHGDYLGFHHMLLKGGAMYDPTVRVPLMIKWPGGKRSGEARRELVSLVDVGPTLIRAAGVDAPASMGGLDLSDPAAGRPMVFAERGGGRDATYMARSRDYKLILGADPEQCLLFDLQADPHELDNRYHDPAYRTTVEEYRRAIGEWLMYEAVPPVQLDEHGPTIDQPNARVADPDHRRRMLDYFWEKAEPRLAPRP